MAVDGGIVRELGADVLEFRFLLLAREADVAALPGGAALLEGDMVAGTAAPQDTLQRARLCGRGLELLLEGLAARGLVAHA